MAIYPPNTTLPKSSSGNYLWNWIASPVENFAKKIASLMGLNDLGSTEVSLVPGTYGPKVTFRKKNYGTEKDVIIPGVLEITRGNNGGIFNIALEPNYNGSVSPLNTEWNTKFLDDSMHGFALAANAMNFTYDIWNTALDTGSWSLPLAQSDQKLQMVMHETTTDRYWLIVFKSWTPGGAGGGFEYDRWEIFPKVDFVRPSGQDNVVDIITPNKTIIKRDSVNGNLGIYNPALESEYLYIGGTGIPRTPSGTLWNSEFTDSRVGYSGWSDLRDLKNRVFSNWYDAVDGDPVTAASIALELVMLDQATGFYYMVEFTSWDNTNGDCSFAYTRRLIPMTKSIDFENGVDLGEGGAIDYTTVHKLTSGGGGGGGNTGGYANYLELNFSSAQIANMNSVPLVLLPAPATGEYYEFKVLFEFTAGTVAFNDPITCYSVLYNAAGVARYFSKLLSGTNIKRIFSTDSNSENGLALDGYSVDLPVTGVSFAAVGSNPTGGNGKLVAKIWYNTLTFNP